MKVSTDSQPAADPKSAVSPTPPAQESADKKAAAGEKSSYWWIILLVLLSGGGYSYTQGWLDRPLAWLEEQQNRPLPLPTSADGSPSQQRVEQAPAQSQTPASNNDLADVVTNLEVLQSRFISLENTTRRLQGISEEHAAQLVRQTGGAIAYDNSNLVNLRLEIIDLRLRLTGDTLAAARELESLETQVERDTQLQQVILANRQRLSQIQTRARVLARLDELANLITQAQTDITTRLQAAESATSSFNDSNLLNSLFQVRKEDLQLRLELDLAVTLATTVEPVKTALLLGQNDDYLASLTAVQRAVDALAGHKATVHTTQIAQLMNELVAIGFPATYLILTDPVPAG